MKKAVALGTFDGLHAGHRAVIEAAHGFDITVVTFELPPKAVITGNTELLMTPERRYKELKSLGVSKTVPLKFSDVRDMPARDFLDMIRLEFAPDRIVCGFNYRFGSGASGDTDMLREYCNSHGIELVCCEPVTICGETVCSSILRSMIREGEISKATERICGGFSFEAPVENGDHRGRTIGFPTVNQRYPDILVTPKFGVYAVKVCFGGREYDGISNIGVRPTYRTKDVFSETYIKDFSGDLYGKNVIIKPIRFIREERRFSGLDELRAAITADIKQI